MRLKKRKEGKTEVRQTIVILIVMLCTSCLCQTVRDITERIEKSIRVDFLFEQEVENWSGYVPAITDEHREESHVVTLQTEHTHGTPQGLLFRVLNKMRPCSVDEESPQELAILSKSRMSILAKRCSLGSLC